MLLQGLGVPRSSAVPGEKSRFCTGRCVETGGEKPRGASAEALGGRGTAAGESHSDIARVSRDTPRAGGQGWGHGRTPAASCLSLPSETDGFFSGEKLKTGKPGSSEAP